MALISICIFALFSNSQQSFSEVVSSETSYCSFGYQCLIVTLASVLLFSCSIILVIKRWRRWREDIPLLWSKLSSANQSDSSTTLIINPFLSGSKIIFFFVSGIQSLLNICMLISIQNELVQIVYYLNHMVFSWFVGINLGSDTQSTGRTQKLSMITGMINLVLYSIVLLLQIINFSSQQYLIFPSIYQLIILIFGCYLITFKSNDYLISKFDKEMKTQKIQKCSSSPLQGQHKLKENTSFQDNNLHKSNSPLKDPENLIYKKNSLLSKEGDEDKQDDHIVEEIINSKEIMLIKTSTDNSLKEISLRQKTIESIENSLNKSCEEPQLNDIENPNQSLFEKLENNEKKCNQIHGFKSQSSEKESELFLWHSESQQISNNHTPSFSIKNQFHYQESYRKQNNYSEGSLQHITTPQFNLKASFEDNSQYLHFQENSIFVNNRDKFNQQKSNFSSRTSENNERTLNQTQENLNLKGSQNKTTINLKQPNSNKEQQQYGSYYQKETNYDKQYKGLKVESFEQKERFNKKTVVYNITYINQNGAKITISRSFREFVDFGRRLAIECQEIIFPSLPTKQQKHQLSSSELSERVKQFDIFLKAVIKNVTFNWPVLHNFLSCNTLIFSSSINKSAIESSSSNQLLQLNPHDQLEL